MIKIANYRDEMFFMNHQNYDSFTRISNLNTMSKTQLYTYVYNLNKKSKKVRKSKIFAMQTNLKNLKKFNFNSVTMFSKILYNDNIFRVFDIKFKRRCFYNVNKLSFFDKKKQLSKKSIKIVARSKKKVKRKEKKKIMKFILNIINKSKINVKNIFIYNNIILSTLYFYQISFYFRNETKRLIQTFKKFKKSNSKINQKNEKKINQKNNASKIYNHIHKNELRCC